MYGSTPPGGRDDRPNDLSYIILLLSPMAESLYDLYVFLSQFRPRDVLQRVCLSLTCVIKVRSVHSWWKSKRMLATYMRRMRNNNLEIRIAGDNRSPQLIMYTYACGCTCLGRHATLNVPSGDLKWENKTYKVERSTIIKLLVLLNGHMLIVRFININSLLIHLKILSSRL